MSQDLAHSDVKTETLIRAAIHEVRAHGFGVGAFASSVMAFAMLPFTRAAMGPAGFFAQQALSLVGRQVAEHKTAENIYPGVENWPTLFFADDGFHTRMRNGYNAIRAECFDMRLYLPEEGQTLHTAIGQVNIEKLSAVASAVGTAIDNWQKKRVVAAQQRAKDLAIEAERAKFLLPVAVAKPVAAPAPIIIPAAIIPAAATAEVPKGMSIVEVAQKGLAVKKAAAEKVIVDKAAEKPAAKPVATVNFARDAKEAVVKKAEGLAGLSVVEVKTAPVAAPVVEKPKAQPKPRLVMTQSGDVAAVPMAAPVAPTAAVVPAKNDKVKEARKAAARKKLRARKQRKIAQNTVAAAKASGGVVAASAKLVAQSVETGVISWTTNFAERLNDVREILQEEAAQKAALAEQIKAKAQAAKQERAAIQAEKDKQAAAQKLIAQAQAQAEAKLKAEQQAQEKLQAQARAAVEAEARKKAKELAKIAAREQAAQQAAAKAAAEAEAKAKKTAADAEAKAKKATAEAQARAKAEAKARANAEARIIAQAEKAVAKAKTEASITIKSAPLKQAVLAVPEPNVVDVHDEAPVIVAVAAPVVAAATETAEVAEAKRRINGVYNKTSNDNRTSKLPSLEKLAKGVVVSHR